MKAKVITIVCSVSLLLTFKPLSAQLFDLSEAPVIARLTEMLRIHRQHLVEAIRTARGIETTFRTLQHLDDYERSLRRDISFISSLDLKRLDDLERVILFGDQSEFYFRSLTGKINSEMYNLNQMQRYGEGFLGSVDGLGMVDANVIRALFDDEKTLAELGIKPEQAEALIRELNIEANLLGMYEIKGTENIIKALAQQRNQLNKIAQNTTIKLDQGQRVILLTKSEESLIEALKYQ